MKAVKRFCAVVLCAGLCAVIAGGGLYYARRETAYREKTIEPTLRLAALPEISARDQLRLCAHRGLSAVAPENTTQAVRAAGEAGFGFVLLDAAWTKDGESVLLADDTVERMTAGRGRVSSYSFAQLARMPLDNGANLSDCGRVQIPRLADALELCAVYGMRTILTVRHAYEMLPHSLQAQLADAYMVVSSRRDVLTSLTGKTQRLCLRTETLTQQDLRYASQHGFAVAFDPQSTPAGLLRQAGDVELWAWPVNTRETLAHAAENGVRNIVTDCILPMSEK